MNQRGNKKGRNREYKFMDLLSKEASQIQTLLCRKFITNMKDSVQMFAEVFLKSIYT